MRMTVTIITRWSIRLTSRSRATYRSAVIGQGESQQSEESLAGIKMRAEISYDLVMNDDMEFVEGAYRLPDGDWQVVVVSAFDRDVPKPQVDRQQWDSGVSGVFVRLPRAERINAATVERVLSAALGVSEWVRVSGPDSMQLR